MTSNKATKKLLEKRAAKADKTQVTGWLGRSWAFREAVLGNKL